MYPVEDVCLSLFPKPRHWADGTSLTVQFSPLWEDLIVVSLGVPKLGLFESTHLKSIIIHPQASFNVILSSSSSIEIGWNSYFGDVFGVSSMFGPKFWSIHGRRLGDVDGYHELFWSAAGWTLVGLVSISDCVFQRMHQLECSESWTSKYHLVI